jgi:hypothetical protein
MRFLDGSGIFLTFTTVYTELYYIPVMSNQQFNGYAGARRNVNSAKEKLKIRVLS